MPEFSLNLPSRGVSDVEARRYGVKARAPHPFYSLDTFARGYVEAMFFTNGDTGDARETLLNDWGVECLTADAVEKIRADCAKFEAEAEGLLFFAYCRPYEVEQAGRDFWFGRQGHGVGFHDREALTASEDDCGNVYADEDAGDPGPDLGKRLAAMARAFGECTVEAYRRKIHVR